MINLILCIIITIFFILLGNGNIGRMINKYIDNKLYNRDRKGHFVKRVIPEEKRYMKFYKDGEFVGLIKMD